MADSKPTPTQLRYLSFIATYIKGLGYAPAETEVVTALKVSSASVNRMIKTLEEKGFIQRKAGIPRSIEVLLPSDLIPQWDEPIFATKPTHARFSAAALTPTERMAKKRPMQRGLPSW
jgi:SOS-response transcriptional repressor LexA